MKPKIIFIHGMFLTAKSWENWVRYFSALGYECEAPAWPWHDQEPAILRADVPDGLKTLSLSQLHEYYRSIIRRETEAPVVIGHSLGGLLVQKLIADQLVRAGIGICSVAPNRMLAFDWDFFRNSASIANPLAGHDPDEMTSERFHQNFANTLTEEQSNAAFERYAVHESRQVFRDIMGDEGHIDLKAPHAPLLLIGAQEDVIIPSQLVRRNAHAYEDKRSHHEYTDFSRRGHFICGEPRWEEVAERIANWLTGHLTALRS